MKVTNETQLNLVIGYPLDHSQSAILHAAVYRLLGINAILIPQPHLKLKLLIQAIKTLRIPLIAVTMPHKEKVLQYADALSSEVESLQAANTLIQRDEKLYAFNTDVAGINFALRNSKIQNKRILIIGAGGAARALGYYLQTKNVKLFWINRTKTKANRLAKIYGGKIVSFSELNSLDIDIVINTTSVGLYPDIDQSPLPHYHFNSSQLVFDMIYNPLETKLLRDAKKNHAKTISGLEMFIGQGLKQIELLTGKSIHDSAKINYIKKILKQNQLGIRL